MTEAPGPGASRTRLWVSDIAAEQAVRGSYLVREKRLATTRSGEPFLSLVLGDRTGEIEGRVWEAARELSEVFREGDLVEIQGKATSFRGKLQVSVASLKPLAGKVDRTPFLESAPRETTEMLRELREVLKQLQQPDLKRLIERFLTDRSFLAAFREAPAAKNFHHCYLGGLLEHTLSVCRLALQVAAHYPLLDRDLLLAGAFLHDIGKTRELTLNPQIDYTDEGRLVGHVVLGAVLLEEKLAALPGFSEELALRLKHLVLSHHGQYDFGSPKRPKFLEAFALHLVDDLDAKINGLARFMARDPQEGAWTDFNRLFERYLLKGALTPAAGLPDAHPADDEKQRTLFSP